MTSRANAVALATAGCYAGTTALVQGIVDESKFVSAWRPLRAGAILAAAHAAPRVWMTRDQFADWITVQSFAARRRGDPVKPAEATGISSHQRLSILRGVRAVEKTEALACAHYAMQLAMPVPAGDVEGFADWCGRTFGAVNEVTKWLDLPGNYITDRMRGFDVRKGVRHEVAPGAGLIRALDWVARVGPICPYGDLPEVETFPPHAGEGG